MFYKKRTHAHIELKETKNMYIKGTFPLMFLA